MCPNLPLANAIIGQPNYTTGTVNSGGVSAATLAGAIGSASANGANLYVADTANHRVLGYSNIQGGATGAASFIIGQPDAATVTPGTAPVSGSPVKFSAPATASIGTSGGKTYLVVADTGNNRVLIWNSPPASNLAPDLVIGQPGLTTSDANHPLGIPSASNLNGPTAATIAGGYLVVADRGNNRVLIWHGVPTSSNQAANVELGQANFQSDNPGIDQFNGTSYVLAMNQPSDVWTDGTHLLVSDTANNRVLYWTRIPGTDNELADDIIGQSSFGQSIQGSGAGRISGAWGVDSDGVNVFVGDTQNNRVLEYSNYLSAPSMAPAAAKVFGQQDFIHNAYNDPDQNNQPGDQRNGQDNLLPTQSVLYDPQGVFVDSSGDLFVTDSNNNRVLRFAVSSGVDGSDTSVPCTP